MSLVLINQLIHTFSGTNPCIRILNNIKTLQETVIDGSIHIDTVHDNISKLITNIIDDDANIETTINCNIMNTYIHKLFRKYYTIIMEMKKAINNKNKSISDDENNNKGCISIYRHLKKENNTKWIIMTLIIQRLMHYLYKNNMISSDMIWINIIKQILLENTQIKTKTKIIILSQLLISFGHTFIQQTPNQSIISEIKTLLSSFIIHFVSTNYKNHNEYNDIHTLKDINTVFELVQIEKKHVQNKKRKRKKRKKNINHSLISLQMRKYYHESRVNDTERQCKDVLIKHIGYLWKKVLFSSLPSLKSQLNYKSFDGTRYVHLFGSTATQLDEKGSDIDLYLTVPKHINMSHAGEWELFQQLSHELETNVDNNGLNVTNIFHCTVPIIKIKDEINDVFVDISFGKSDENGKIVRLLNDLCDYNGDERIRELIIVIKYWAKKRNLIDGKKNKLSSFGFVLIVMRYLQSQNDYDNKRILPMLRKRKIVNQGIGNDVEIMLDDGANSYRNMKRMSLSHLLNGFFQFYCDFDYVYQSISLFKQKVVKNNRRYRDLNGYQMKGDKCCFVIEDPIQTNYNCAKNVRPFTANLMKIEFLRAKLLFKYCNAHFNDLCRSAI